MLVLLVVSALLPAGRASWRFARALARAAADPGVYGQTGELHERYLLLSDEPTVVADPQTWQEWFVVALEAPPGPESAPAWQQALALTDDPETVALARAVCAQRERPLRAGERAEPAQVTRHLDAARAATQQAPDNALGWYLLAIAESDAGRATEALAAIKEGNRAPRFDDRFRAQVTARLAGERLPAGTPADLAWARAMSGVLLPHLAPLRQMARDLAADGGLEAHAELAAMGLRLFDDSTLVVTGMNGLAVVGIAAPRPDELGGVPAVKLSRTERAAREMRHLADELNQGGQPARAAWASEEADRLAALRLQPIEGMPPGTMARTLRGIALTYAALACLLAALACLLGLFWWRRLKAAQPWPAVTLYATWIVTVWPAVLLLAYVAFTAVRNDAGVHTLRPDLLSLLGAGAALPLLLSLLLLRWRRLATAGSSQTQTHAAAGLLLPTAALLILVAGSFTVAAYQQRQSSAALWAASDLNEAARWRGEAVPQEQPAASSPNVAWANSPRP